MSITEAPGIQPEVLKSLKDSFKVSHLPHPTDPRVCLSGLRIWLSLQSWDEFAPGGWSSMSSPQMFSPRNHPNESHSDLQIYGCFSYPVTGGLSYCDFRLSTYFVL